MNFFISDCHIGHENAIRFDNRPFRNLSDMWMAIKANWNARVKSTDTVYILGDFIWHKEQDWAYYLEQLNGRKVLIRGNHDPKEFSRSTRSLFVDIRERMEITDNGRHVIMDHYPLPCFKGDYSSETYMLYGHVHNTREAEYIRAFRDYIRSKCCGAKGEPLGQFLHVGCMEPYMDYTPRTLDEIIQGDAEYYPVR